VINRRKAQVLTTTIPIFNLVGGVGRQAPNKRLPTEAENIDNALVTLQRSVEKRPGFELLSGLDDSASEVYNLPNLSTSDTDYWYYWFTINEDNRYLIVVNYKATLTDELLRIFKIDADGQGYVEQDSSAFNMSSQSLEYITYGNDTYEAREVLKGVTFGTQVLILNTKVKAGFTSADDGNGNYYTFNLDGTQTSSFDFLGPKIQYYTSVAYDTSGNPYTVSAGAHNDATIPVEDLTNNVFPTQPQAVDDFSEIEFPPSLNDWYVPNWFIQYTSGSVSDDNRLTQIVLNNLHDPDHPYYDELDEDETVAWPYGGPTFGLTFPNGRGKIYYAAGPFLTQPSGYYRIVSFEENKTYDGGSWATDAVGKSRPYTQRVRTPDALSVIDKYRMPQALKLEGGSWSLDPIPWKPRLSGDTNTNPGPSVFSDVDGNAVQSEITSMAVFRSRLWMSSRDKVFSSQVNDYENLWIEDPTTIVDTDPIDVTASTNSYAEILSMTPFSNYLFINTKGDIQFELSGSENRITPFTAEMSPTTFYSTAPLVNPVLMGSQIYFFDSRRLYLYFSDIASSVNSSVEVTEHCPDYLPDNYRAITVAAPQDMIIAVDDDNPNNLYMYVNKFSGDRVIQNSFFRYVLDEGSEVVTTRAFENYLYAVIIRDGRFWLERTLLRKEDNKVPRIDHYVKVTLGVGNSSYSGGTGITTYVLPWVDTSITEVILGPEWGELENLRVPVDSISTNGTTTTITVSGDNYSYTGATTPTVYFGHSFNMNIELSKQFFRSEDGNIVDGLLSLRSMVTRHFETGDYKIVVTRNGRAATVTEFNSQIPDGLQDTLSLDITELEGELVSKLLGMADDLVISIQSDYPTPCNITHIELRGKLKRSYSTLR
jgi:hypothetical protein